MKCNSCSEVVPPRFAHSIKTNTCPFCGLEIMDPALQAVLSQLQEAMKAAEPYTEQVDEWFASNYSLKKIKPREAGPGINSNHQQLPSGGLFDTQEEFDEDTMRRQADATSFQKRAGVKGMDAKSLIEKIQGGKGAADPSEFVGVDDEYGAIDMGKEMEGTAPLSQKDALQMISALDKGVKEDPVEKYYEMEKLRKLQRAAPSGQGRFSRGDG